MAPVISNQGNPCKCLASIFLINFVNSVTSVEHHIVPLENYPCSAGHCLTLSQFVSTFANCSKCDTTTTLIFAPGIYDLETKLVIEDVDSFSILIEPFSTNPQIICSFDARFEVRNINTVTINGLDFVECYENVLESVSRFHITESTFYTHPERDVTTLTITESTAYLERITFLFIDKSVQDHTITKLKPQQNCTSNSTAIYRILANNSVLIIKESLFDKSVIEVGAVVSDLGDSEITIFNSTFSNNWATCCSSEICVGGILRVSGGTIAVYDSRFEHNQGIVSKILRGIASFSNCVFSDNFGSFSDDFVDGDDDEDDVPLENMMFVVDSYLNIKYSRFIITLYQP